MSSTNELSYEEKLAYLASFEEETAHLEASARAEEASAPMEEEEEEEGEASSSSSSDESDEGEAVIVPTGRATFTAADAASIVRANVGRGKEPYALARMTAAAAAASTASAASAAPASKKGKKRERHPLSEEEEEEEEEEEADAKPHGYQVSKAPAKKAKSSGEKPAVPVNVAYRDNSIAMRNENPVIGEKFKRGEVEYTVVSTVATKGENGWFPVKNAHTQQKFLQPDWSNGALNLVFNARISDRTDAAAYESFVQTSRFQFFAVSLTGARYILTRDMQNTHGKASAIPTKAYKASALEAANRFPKLDGEGDRLGDATWLPWALYNHTIANRHEAVAVADDDAAAAAAATGKSKAPAKKGRTAAAANTQTLPPLLITLAKEFCDNELEPHCRSAASASMMVSRLDSSIELFAKTWKKDTVEEVAEDMVNRYKMAKSKKPSLLNSVFTVNMQVRMFMMIHPAGLAIVQELRNKLQKEVMEAEEAGADYV